MPHFQFDHRKSESNKLKHGIDFEEAARIWDGPVFEFPIREHGRREMRYLVLGKIDGKHYTAIISYRGGSIRLISVRQSNSRELDLYVKSQEEIQRTRR